MGLAVKWLTFLGVVGRRVESGVVGLDPDGRCLRAQTEPAHDVEEFFLPPLQVARVELPSVVGWRPLLRTLRGEVELGVCAHLLLLLLLLGLVEVGLAVAESLFCLVGGFVFLDRIEGGLT